MTAAANDAGAAEEDPRFDTATDALTAACLRHMRHALEIEAELACRRTRHRHRRAL